MMAGFVPPFPSARDQRSFRAIDLTSSRGWAAETRAAKSKPIKSDEANLSVLRFLTAHPTERFVED
jgi:hypothetical protein